MGHLLFLMAILVAIFNLTILNRFEVIVMYLAELLIIKNLYFATNFIKISVLELKL